MKMADEKVPFTQSRNKRKKGKDEAENQPKPRRVSGWSLEHSRQLRARQQGRRERKLARRRALREQGLLVKATKPVVAAAALKSHKGYKLLDKVVEKQRKLGLAPYHYKTVASLNPLLPLGDAFRKAGISPEMFAKAELERQLVLGERGLREGLRLLRHDPKLIEAFTKVAMEGSVKRVVRKSASKRKTVVKAKVKPAVRRTPARLAGDIESKRVRKTTTRLA